MEALFILAVLIVLFFLSRCADVLERGGEETDMWFSKYSAQRDMINAKHERGEISWKERDSEMKAIKVD